VRALGARYPDGYTLPAHRHGWSQLLYAAEGVMLVEAAGASWVVPPLRAVWVPAKVEHTIHMRGAVAMRTVYFAERLHAPLRATSVVEVAPLLRELVVHCATLGKLDLRVPHEQRLARLILDLLAELPALPVELPMPRDPRARRVAEAVRREPARSEIAELARLGGASARTVERLFVAETGMSFGRWRQQARLLHALTLLAADTPVTSVALDVGYGSASAFIAGFRAAFGTTPGRFFTRASA
jgi:AraC-like DNA-binding protein